MATQSRFGRSVRVLACSGCGAPLDVPPSGGSARCSYCDAVLNVPGRDESAEREALARAPAIDEAERFERLRRQAGSIQGPPEAVAHLAVAGLLRPNAVEAAMAEWRQARVEVAGGAAFPAAERLFHLTVLLSEHLARLRDDRRQRSLLETAMELLQAPRHRQVLRGTLARNAAREGDLQAADEWLAGCSPRSDDIHVDTAWRLTKAYLCTARGDFAGVIQVLGSRVGDVPVVPTEAEACGLLRANALERSGQAEQAAEQLYAIMRQGARGAAPLVEHLVLHAELGLCPASFPLAKGRADAEIAAEGRRRVSDSTSLVGPIVALVLLGPAGLVPFVSLATEALLGRDPPWPIAIVGLMFLGFAGLTLHLGLLGNLRTRRRHIRVYETGLDATVSVLSVVRGGKNEPDSLKALVQLPARPPYEAVCQVSLVGGMAERAVAGRTLPAKVDPSDPQLVLVF